MRINDIDIDILVQTILTDLTVKPEPLHPEPKVVSLPKNEVFIDRRVISLADLKEKINGATKLIIPPKSILTPSAKDEIRRQKIEIAVRLPNAAIAGQPSLWLALHGNDIVSQNTVSRLQQEFKTETETFVEWTELLNRAEKKLIETKIFGLALTRQPAMLIVEGNRKTNIRAIAAFDPVQTAEDLKEINANLAVVHSGRVSETKILNIVNCLISR